MAVTVVLILFLAVLQSVAHARVPLPPFVQNNGEEKSCFHGDSLHKPWERFADESCTGWCICNGRTGHVGCVSLCPPRGLPMCPPGKLPEVIEEPSADPTGTCKCRRKSCSPRLNLPPPPPPVKLPEEHVRPECINRLPNKWFINDSCSARCRCRFGGIACVSLCPPMIVECSSDMEKESYDEPMDDKGRCSCKRERCVAKVGV